MNKTDTIVLSSFLGAIIIIILAILAYQIYSTNVKANLYKECLTTNKEISKNTNSYIPTCYFN